MKFITGLLLQIWIKHKDKVVNIYDAFLCQKSTMHFAHYFKLMSPTVKNNMRIPFSYHSRLIFYYIIWVRYVKDTYSSNMSYCMSSIKSTYKLSIIYCRDHYDNADLWWRTCLLSSHHTKYRTLQIFKHYGFFGLLRIYWFFSNP